MRSYFFVFSLFLLCSSSYLYSQNKGFTLKVDDAQINRSYGSAPSSYSEALKNVTPAVVAVTTQQIVRRLYPGNSLNPKQEFLRRYFGIPDLSKPRIEEEMVPAGIGSGVIVTPEGHTITNAHVITDPRTVELVQEVIIQLSNKKEYQAKIIGFDRSTDVAVLKIEADE